MMQRANLTSRLFSMGIVAIAIAFGALIGSWSFSDRSFQKGFESALAERNLLDSSAHLDAKHARAPEFAVSAAVKSSENSNLKLPISGSEEFWLGQTRFTGASTRRVAMSGPFKLGDQLAIGPAPIKRVWTVINISELTQLTTSSAADRTPSILLVTLQDRTSNSATGPLMRIIVDTNDLLLGTRVSSAGSPATL